MKITNGLTLIAATLAVTACGTTAPSASATSPPVPPAVTSEAATSPAAADCQTQVQAWAVSTVKPILGQVAAEFGKLSQDTSSNPANLPNDAGPLLTTAEHFAPQEPPSCASSLSRDWADYITDLIKLAAKVKLNVGSTGIISAINSVNSAVSGLQHDLSAYGE